MKTILRITLLSIILFISSGCTAQDFLRDLSVSHVSFIENRDIRSSGLNPSLNKLKGYNGRLIKVDLTTKEDLLAYSGKKNLLLSDQVVFCDMPEKHLLISPFGLFVDKQEVNLLLASGLQDERQYSTDDKGKYIYSLFLFEVWEKEYELPISFQNDDQRHYWKFDLAKTPFDVCITISGSSAAKANFVSNEVILSKEVIRSMGSE